jgi:soluble lytic murein transglycosylase-like protein
MDVIDYRKAILISLIVYILASFALFNTHACYHLFHTFLNYLRDPTEYDPHIQDASKRYGLDHRLIKALIKVESRFDSEAISPKGAMGLMQLMPETAKIMGVSHPLDPKENIDGGARYLKYLLKQFNNDVSLALAAYNAGPDAVKRYGGVPPFKETREYLRKVLEFYSDYREAPERQGSGQRRP